MWKYFSWRMYKAFFLKMMRSSDSPDYLARGVALGLFIGFLVPMGLQIAVVLPLAFLLKAAKIPAVAFTFVTNHLTVFFIYPVQCWIGSYLMFHPFRYDTLVEQLRGLIDAPDMNAALAEIAQLGGQLVASFFLGGLLFGVIFGLLGYFLTYGATVRFHARRAGRKKARSHTANDL